MKILLTGATGGMGSAIKEALKEHEVIEVSRKQRKNLEGDWLICAHGVLDEKRLLPTFLVNAVWPITLTNNSKISQGIIYISSTAALGGNSKYPVYSASKAALNIYAKSMQKAHPALQFYALCPGPTKTKMWDKLGLSGTPQEPVEVAKAVQRIMAGEFKGHVVITVRNGKVVWV